MSKYYPLYFIDEPMETNEVRKKNYKYHRKYSQPTPAPSRKGCHSIYKLGACLACGLKVFTPAVTAVCVQSHRK